MELFLPLRVFLGEPGYLERDLGTGDTHPAGRAVAPGTAGSSTDCRFPDGLGTSVVRVAEQPPPCARAADKGGITLIKRPLGRPAASGVGGLSGEGLSLPLSILDYCQSHWGTRWLCESTSAYVKPAIAVTSSFN